VDAGSKLFSSRTPLSTNVSGHRAGAGTLSIGDTARSAARSATACSHLSFCRFAIFSLDRFSRQRNSHIRVRNRNSHGKFK
jgi:hypothetical protein